MEVLKIVWLRLVDASGRTCDRCNATHAAVENAIDRLQTALAPLGISVAFEARELTRDEFLGDPAQSNRIWIAGTPLEEWLGADVGSSRCCSACEGTDCRTVELEGVSFEAIPPELIVRASLVAASTLIRVGRGSPG